MFHSNRTVFHLYETLLKSCRDRCQVPKALQYSNQYKTISVLFIMQNPGSVNFEENAAGYNISLSPENTKERRLTLRAQFSKVGELFKNSYIIYYATILFLFCGNNGVRNLNELNEGGMLNIANVLDYKLDQILVKNYIEKLKAAKINPNSLFNIDYKRYQEILQANIAVRHVLDKLTTEQKSEVFKTIIVTTYATYLFFVNNKIPTFNEVEKTVEAAGYKIPRNQFIDGMVDSIVRNPKMHDTFEKTNFRPFQSAFIKSFIEKASKSPVEKEDNYVLLEAKDHFIAISILLAENKELTYDNIQEVLSEQFNVKANPETVSKVISFIDKPYSRQLFSEEQLNEMYNKVFYNYVATLTKLSS